MRSSTGATVFIGTGLLARARPPTHVGLQHLDSNVQNKKHVNAKMPYAAKPTRWITC